jgi:hypothetical protein
MVLAEPTYASQYPAATPAEVHQTAIVMGTTDSKHTSSAPGPWYIATVIGAFLPSILAE